MTVDFVSLEMNAENHTVKSYAMIKAVTNLVIKGIQKCANSEVNVNS